MNLDGYVTVDERLRAALEQFPDLRIVEQRPQVVTIGDATFVSVTTAVYRSPDDPMPAEGTAWEPFPGRTPFTRDSEMMNAATSALGRALGYMGLGLKGSIASADEIRTAQRRNPPDDRRGPQKAPESTKPVSDAQRTLIAKMAAERGVQREVPDTFAEASKVIEELKTIPQVK